jgi:hypothetical protein
LAAPECAIPTFTLWEKWAIFQVCLRCVKVRNFPQLLLRPKLLQAFPLVVGVVLSVWAIIEMFVSFCCCTKRLKERAVKEATEAGVDIEVRGMKFEIVLAYLHLIVSHQL